MEKLLVVIANPKEQDSYSRWGTEELVSRYRKNNPGATIEFLDLYNIEIPLLDKDILSAWSDLGSGKPFSELSEAVQKKVTLFNTFTEQFIAADKYIFAYPMWNFSIPPLLKVYIDTFVIAGKTFQYGSNGVEAIKPGKKAIHVMASGGDYSSDSYTQMDFASRYIQHIFEFIGIESQALSIRGIAQKTFVEAEAKNVFIEQADQALNKF